ncbi:uncharacterized protein LOC121369074 isoform X2 [Gigantopelta aegis]|uniref:uncharacterized protein LOC121369074 isoform X2 n=1 Tax=Gigantopelta aegis TaxID=1735272 RepID=UPI001B889150|nr:uncharacterized protein LOC121369074 isoform X2 [Gigantopelta aegis]
MALLRFLLIGCIIGYSDELKLSRRFRESKMALITKDVHMLQSNITQLWKSVHHIQNDHASIGGAKAANVSVSISGVEGEEIMSTQDSTGTHVHVHLHMDAIPYSKEGGMHGMHGMNAMHGMHAMHGHQGMHCKKCMKGMEMMNGKQGMKGMKMMNGKQGMQGMQMMNGKQSMKDMNMSGGKGMKGMHMMHGKQGMKGMHMMHGQNGPWQGSGMNMASKEFKKKHHWHYPEPDQYLYARCNVNPDKNLADTEKNRITGVIQLRQKMHHDIEIRVHLQGFDLETTIHHHGFHVHQFGDDSEGCKSFGGHFNPDETVHGGPHDDVRHVGDWGNIHCNSKGEAHKNFTDTHAQLLGPHSIMGRGIVIHHHKDDHGKGDSPASKLSGDAGPRLACCVIVWTADQDWSKPFHPNHNAPH